MPLTKTVTLTVRLNEAYRIRCRTLEKRSEAGSCFESATGTIALEIDKQIKDAVIHNSQTALTIKCYKKAPILFSV